MLTLTEKATTAVTTIVTQAASAPDAGLRIAAEPNSANLGLIVADSPKPGDEVLEDSGARIFLDDTAMQALDDKILDAEYQPSGGVQFLIAPQ